MDFTINEWAIVALVFILGWLLGLASRSDRRWRRQYEQERTAHEALCRDHEMLKTDHDTRVRAANTRITELERHASPITAGTAGTIAAAAAGHRDDLTRIDGIDAHDENRLNDAGLHSYRDLAALSGEDATTLEGRLGYAHGRIDSQRWREQAALLADGRTVPSGIAHGAPGDHRI